MDKNKQYTANSDCMIIVTSTTGELKSLSPLETEKKNLFNRWKLLKQKVDTKDNIQLKTAPAAGLSQKKKFFRKLFIFIPPSSNQPSHW
ncbi:MAG: hypothetical protein E7050_08955 [Lentisphaerae bacterium]|nr:hypothetical protein [Lentisphaerota bacterium]